MRPASAAGPWSPRRSRPALRSGRRRDPGPAAMPTTSRPMSPPGRRRAASATPPTRPAPSRSRAAAIWPWPATARPATPRRAARPSPAARPIRDAVRHRLFGQHHARPRRPASAPGPPTSSTAPCTRASADGGKHLYPAFPYPYFTHMTRADVDAILAYLKTRARRSTSCSRPTELPFPFNIRCLMAVWNALFFHAGRVPARSGEVARMEPRRLSGRGTRPLRRLPHAEELPRRRPQQPRAPGRHARQLVRRDLTGDAAPGSGAGARPTSPNICAPAATPAPSASGSMEEVVYYSTSRMSDADLRGDRDLSEGPAARRAQVRPAGAERGRDARRRGDLRRRLLRLPPGERPGRAALLPAARRRASLQQRTRPPRAASSSPARARCPRRPRPTPLAMPAFAWKLDDDADRRGRHLCAQQLGQPRAAGSPRVRSPSCAGIRVRLPPQCTLDLNRLAGGSRAP